MYIVQLISILFIIIVDWILMKKGVVGHQDPCYFHQEMNDATMTLGYVLGPSESALCDVISPGWTRFTGSDEGLMATSCPSDRECGSDQQVWMKGLIPSYYDGTTEIEICIRGHGDCCDRLNRLQVKNCNGFIVYNLISIPPCSRYCFNESSQLLVTVSTTTSSTTTSIYKSNSSYNKEDGLSAEDIAGIVSGTVALIVTVAAIFGIYLIKTRGKVVVPEVVKTRWKNK